MSRGSQNPAVHFDHKTQIINSIEWSDELDSLENQKSRTSGNPYITNLGSTQGSLPPQSAPLFVSRHPIPSISGSTIHMAKKGTSPPPPAYPPHISHPFPLLSARLLPHSPPHPPSPPRPPPPSPSPPASPHLPTVPSLCPTRLTPPPSIAKSRTIAVRLLSMAATGFYMTFRRPRTHRPLSMLKYDPVG